MPFVPSISASTISAPTRSTRENLLWESDLTSIWFKPLSGSPSILISSGSLSLTLSTILSEYTGFLFHEGHRFWHGR